MGADGTGFWKIALCFFIKIDEANDHLVCIALKRFCHGAKGFDMVCRRVGMIDENGVVTPDDAICAYLMGQVLERRKNVPFARHVGFDVPAIGRNRHMPKGIKDAQRF